MSNYTKTVDFAAKDTLPSGDSGKIIKGTEFETEFDNISTAIATKADSAAPTFTGTSVFTNLDINGTVQADGAVTVGVDDTGYDVKFFGATAGKSLLWDESADTLIVTGTTTLVGTANLDAVDVDGDMTFGDNNKAIFGAGSDLQIYHTGTYSLIADTSGTGPLRVVTNTFQLNNAADTQNMINAAEGGAVNLYHAGNAKLATTATGIDVTGDIVLGDTNPTITMNDSSVTNLQHLITSSSDRLIIAADNNDVSAGSKIEFYVDGTKYSEVTPTGIDVTGTVTANDLTLGDASPTISFNDSDLANLNHYITSASNANLYYAADSAAVAAGKHVFTTQNVERLDISSSGINVTGTVTADGLTVDGDASVAGTTGATVDTGTITTGKDSVSTRTHWRMNNPNGEVAKWDSNGTDLLHFITDEYKVYTAGNKAFEIDGNGDISFYEDTGTTPKLVWKSADERLGIGDSSPDGILDVEGSITIAGSQAGVIFNPSVTPANNNVGSVGLVSGTLNAPASTNANSKISGLRVAPTTSGSFNGAGEIAGIKVETFNGQSATLATGLYVDAPTGGDVNYAAILNGGNVGIGTDSPTAKVNIDTAVAGDGGASSATRNLLLVQTSGTQATAGTLKIDGIIHPSVYRINIDSSTGAGAAAPLSFSTANGATETMRIDASGKVGIGESDPSGYWSQANQLVIEDGNCGLTLKSAVSGVGRLVFTDTKSTTAGLNDGGMISYNHADDAMIVQTAGDEAMRIDASGRVGIGNSVMSSMFSSSQNLVVGTGSGNNGITVYSQSNAVGDIAFADATSDPAYYSGLIRYDHSLDAMRLFTSSEERLRIAADGSLSTPTLGTSNVRLGSGAGSSLASGANSNTLVGDEAGTAITTGDYNAAFGQNALASNVTGSRNTAIGRSALETLNPDTEASYNTAVGFSAGAQVTTGVNNTLIGGLAGDALTTAYSNVGVGYLALSSDTKGVRSVAIGQSALEAQNFSSAITNTYNVAVGYSAGSAVTTGIRNVLIGGLAGDALQDADFNVGVGYGALSADTLGSGSVAIGDFTLVNQNFTSATTTYNTAVGYSAGAGVTTGTENTLVGGLSGDALTTGGRNVAVGYAALSSETTGYSNTAIGYQALLTQNNTSSTNVYNTAVGRNAGLSVTTGTHNTFIGGLAGDTVQSGSNNILIGYGADAVATQENSITIGIGISGGNNDFVFGKVGNVVFNDFDTDAAWTRSSDERLKKNITDQALGLDFIKALRTVKYNWKSNNELDASDAQLAHLREEDSDGNIINYMNTDVVMHNFIAQEVKAALDAAGVSDFGGWKEDQYGVQQVSREMFVIPLVKAIQEQQAIIDSLTARIEALES